MDELPDELLISIISLLPSAKERTRTSVLAQRWRNLWKFTRILNFNDAEISQELSDAEISQELKDAKKSRELRYWSKEQIIGKLKKKTDMKRFVEIVNGVLLTHSAETLDELRIESDLEVWNARDIDRWIELAFRKRVQKLELKFREIHVVLVGDSFIWFPKYAYTFPNVQRFDVSPHFSSLVSLSLVSLYLSAEIIASLMFNCPNLEDLHVERARGLEKLELSCQATRLRRLALIDCDGLNKIKTCSQAPNLVSYELASFECGSHSITRTKLSGVSSLVHLSLRASSYDKLVFQQLGDVSGCLSRLETLKLFAGELRSKRKTLEYKLPSLPRLRKLVLRVELNEPASVLCFAPIINRAPLLEEIVLRVTESGWDGPCSRKPKRAVMKLEVVKHECLKVMEVEGYVGKAVDLEMVVYLMDYAASLEKVVIDGVAHTGEDLHLLKNLFREVVTPPHFENELVSFLVNPSHIS